MKYPTDSKSLRTKTPARYRGSRVLALGLSLCFAGTAHAEPARAGGTGCAATIDQDVDELLRLRSDGAQESSGSGLSPAERVRFGLAVIMNDFFIQAANRKNTPSLPPALRALPPGELRKRRDSGVVDSTVCEIVGFMRQVYSANPASDPADTQGRSVLASAQNLGSPPSAPRPAAGVSAQRPRDLTSPAVAAPQAVETRPAPAKPAETAAAQKRASAENKPEAPKQVSAAAASSPKPVASAAPRATESAGRAAQEREPKPAAEKQASEQAASAESSRKPRSISSGLSEALREAGRSSAATAPAAAPLATRAPATESTPRPETPMPEAAAVREARATEPTPEPATEPRIDLLNRARAAEPRPVEPREVEIKTAEIRASEPRVPEIRSPEIQAPEPEIREPEISPPAGSVQLEPALLAAANSTMKAIDAALAAPLYLTRKELRVDARNRTDRELRTARKKTVDARMELLDLLRALAAEPQRHAALRKMIGPEACARVERRIEALFEGGPGAEDGPTAIQLWKGPAEN